MSLNINEPPVENQLPQAIRKMRDFLLTRPMDKEYYKTLYDSIDNLVVKATTEGWFGYQHKNPYKVLADFLNNNNASNLVVKYYSIPTLRKELIKQSGAKKVIKGGKKFLEWSFDQLSKITPNIKN